MELPIKFSQVFNVLLNLQHSVGGDLRLTSVCPFGLMNTCIIKYISIYLFHCFPCKISKNGPGREARH